MIDQEKLDKMFASLPTPPATAKFRLLGLQAVASPHEYMVGTAHVAYASDFHGGNLGVDAIMEGEAKGILKCCVPRCETKFENHKREIALMVGVPLASNVFYNTKQVEGLTEYLVGIKSKLASMGIDQIGFPTIV